MGIDEIKERLLAHKRTSVLGSVIGALGGVAVAMRDGPYGQYAQIAVAACVLAGSIGLLFARD